MHNTRRSDKVHSLTEIQHSRRSNNGWFSSWDCREDATSVHISAAGSDNKGGAITTYLQQSATTVYLQQYEGMREIQPQYFLH